MTTAAAPPARLAGLRALAGRLLGPLDMLVAVLLTVGGLAEVTRLTYAAPAALGVTSCVLCTATVAVRRRIPFTAAATAVTALTAYQIATHDPDGAFVAPAMVLTYYYAGRSAAERRAWRRLAALLGYGLAGMAAIGLGTGTFVPGSLGAWAFMLLSAAAGVIVARHVSMTRQLAEATASLRDEQRVRAARALGEERNRIARELHDVVAHHVGVMVIQASAARLMAAADPAAGRAALRVIEQSGGEALVDLRRIIGVLHRQDTPDGAMPAGLAHLDALAERTRLSGVPVEVQASGPVDQVPAAVDLVAYRVVQEALTNVVKHARSASARVMISVGRHSLWVMVTDDGAGPAGPGLPASGHGLAGMRERVELYGGTLVSRHRAGGGFEVRADIPLRSGPLECHETSNDASVLPQWRPAVALPHWLGGLRPWSDLLLAGFWLAALEGDALTDQYRRGPLALNLAAVAVIACAFASRRRFAGLFLLVAALAAVALRPGLASSHATLVGFYCVSVPLFTVASWRPLRPALAGLLFWTAGLIGSGVIWHQPAGGIVGGVIMSWLLWAAGRVWRGHRLLAERLAETHALLAAERDDRERLAIATERGRIARELHTLVAQDVVGMVVRASAAQRAFTADPAAAVAAAGAIEQAGREALARMRDILGVLRARQTVVPRQPQPGLGQLHTLIQQLRDGGRTVELSIEGEPSPLPAGVDLTAYRIIEAALTTADTRRTRAVTVAVRFRVDGVEVDVAGSGLRLSRQLRVTVGERAALCAGAVLPPAPDQPPRLVVRLPLTGREVLTA
ncbi:MAG TPA: histidine kinase [Trebonia sp.]|jgi:signal transduction histidine kinase|nr:histidine kinase [Trebonia sp.]